MSHQPVLAVSRPDTFRRVMGSIPTGVAVVTSADAGGAFVGLTVNSLASLSLDPPLVTWALRLESPLVSAFRSRGAFVVNLLAVDQQALSRRFASPSADRFDALDTTVTHDGLPRIEGAAAYLECVVHRDLAVGDHVLFVGTVRMATATGRRMLGYCAGRYFDLETSALAHQCVSAVR